jgi:hypothetical protein
VWPWRFTTVKTNPLYGAIAVILGLADVTLKRQGLIDFGIREVYQNDELCAVMGYYPGETPDGKWFRVEAITYRKVVPGTVTLEWWGLPVRGIKDRRILTLEVS